MHQGLPDPGAAHRRAWRPRQGRLETTRNTAWGPARSLYEADPCRPQRHQAAGSEALYKLLPASR